VKTLFGGFYDEEKTVRLLCEVERFKIDANQANKMNRINPKARPTGKYVIFKPAAELTKKATGEMTRAVF